MVIMFASSLTFTSFNINLNFYFVLVCFISELLCQGLSSNILPQIFERVSSFLRSEEIIKKLLVDPVVHHGLPFIVPCNLILFLRTYDNCGGRAPSLALKKYFGQ